MAIIVCPQPLAAEVGLEVMRRGGNAVDAAVTNATGNGSAPANAGSDAITASISKPMSVITPVLWPMFGTSFPIQVTSSQRVEY